MKKGNILVLGNSGVGKSTLINAVLGDDRAETGFGISGTTKELKIYESELLPFRVIDTIGFEPSFIKSHQAVNAVKKWSKESAKEGKEDTQINIIWFCVEGTSSKLFPETIESLSRSASMWPSVPIITVITKSYSESDRTNNVEMVHAAFAKQKHYSPNMKCVIPVVAALYRLNESAFAPPEGITELIEETNKLIPEGIRAAEKDISSALLKTKRTLAQAVVGTATTGAVVTAAIPKSISDALILAPIELAEINAIASIYGIGKDEKSKQFIDRMVEVGTVSLAAKAAVGLILKWIPILNVGAAVVCSIVAGSIVASLGEGAIYIFEQIYLGNKTADDVDWMKKFLESELASKLSKNIDAAMEKASKSTDTVSITDTITELFSDSKTAEKEISKELSKK